MRAVKEPPFNVVLWDNGSSDDTVDEVSKRYSDILVHYHAENLGVAGGRNQGAQLAIREFAPDLLLFLDNDTIVTPDFLEPLCRPFEKDEQLAQTSPKLMYLKDKNRINMAGGANIKFWNGSTAAIGYNEIDTGQYDEANTVIP